MFLNHPAWWRARLKDYAGTRLVVWGLRLVTNGRAWQIYRRMEDHYRGNREEG